MDDAELFAFDCQGFLHRRGALLPAHTAMLRDVDALVPGPQRLTDAYSITRRRGLGLPLHSIELADYGVRRGRPTTHHLTVMVCLSDCGPEDGPFVAIAGSHRSEVRFPWSPIHADWQMPDHDADAVAAALRWIEPEPRPRVRWEDIPGYREITFAAGDVLVFTEDLWHGARGIASDRVRRTLYFSYSPYHFANWHGLGRSAQLLARCTGRRRELLDGPFVGNTFTNAPALLTTVSVAAPHLLDGDGDNGPLLPAIAARLTATRVTSPRAGRVRVHAGNEVLLVELGPRPRATTTTTDTDADTCVVASRETMEGLLARRTDAVAAFYRGEVEVRGDMALAMAFAAQLLADDEARRP